MRKRALLAAPAVLLAMAALARGQTTQPYDPAPLLEKLADPSTAQAAAASIEQFPAAALSPLYDVLLDPATSDHLKELLNPAVAKLHQRLREAAAKKSAEMNRAWYERSGPDIFRKLPHDNPAADALAQKALDEIIDKPEQAYTLAKAAADAGSEDPLVLYYVASRVPNSVPPEQQVAMTVAATAALTDAPYPASRKIMTLLHCAVILAQPHNAAALKAAKIPANRADHLLFQALALLPEVSKETTSPETPGVLLELARAAADRIDKENGAQTFNRVFGPFNNAFPNQHAVLAYAADYYTTFAWEARGSGFADTVTDSGWARFKQRLDQAEQYAKRAIAADPVAADGPTVMLTICLGKSYERPVMEAWFTRAMNADPDNYSACAGKETYLLPQWFGSEQELLAFGRECALRGTGVNRIPLILVEAHEELRNMSNDAAGYMKQIEVWADIQSAFDKVLEEERGKVPGEVVRSDRARYLKYAAECEQWNDFTELAAKFGDAIDMDVFGGEALLDFYKNKAAAAAKKDPA